MERTMLGRRAWLALVLAVGLSGCAGAGWEDLLYGIPGGGRIQGQVDWVDTRRREFGVRGGWGGEDRVRYDSRTQVVEGRRRYGVGRLRRGDYVSVSMDSRGYARTVYLERVTRDRGDARVQRFDGRVTWVDTRSNRFGMRIGRGDYTVNAGSGAGPESYRRIGRLRNGDRVRIEGRQTGGGQISLYRFR